MLSSSEMAERIRALILEQGYKIGAFLVECGGNADMLNTMKSYYPRLQVMCKIAERLGVPLDSLTSEEVRTGCDCACGNSEAVTALLRSVEGLSEFQVGQVVGYADALRAEADKKEAPTSSDVKAI